jgi:hypothetical protein
MLLHPAPQKFITFNTFAKITPSRNDPGNTPAGAPFPITVETRLLDA